MLPVYLLLTCLLGATYARAVEHPKRHFRSAKPLGVHVHRSYMYMSRYDSVVIKCHVRMPKGIPMPMHVPDIHFGVVYCWLMSGVLIMSHKEKDEEIQYRHRTVVPLSNGFPGVRISPSQHVTKSDGKTEHERIVKYIRLSPPLFRFLNYGENVFFCQANSHTPEGRSEYGSAYFTINKI
ncbi:hypothetical protein CAPTEDRAFT_204000 [Capitella teleta]|uniref:Uncharacterized protein n=1 Tax=Capitella teleta TaxID=283909 RepID=R7UVL0_CAPTE|nr:hypothetical protein CAPTEDRAFT_204000 [Capitella teleta]|eukprot:ELU10344.1 hypothetical protein CAPTEDRAFT_204000 [Capitella teleta]